MSQDLLSLTLAHAQLRSADDALTTFETALSELISPEGHERRGFAAWTSRPGRSGASA